MLRTYNTIFGAKIVQFLELSIKKINNINIYELF